MALHKGYEHHSKAVLVSCTGVILCFLLCLWDSVRVFNAMVSYCKVPGSSSYSLGVSGASGIDPKFLNTSTSAKYPCHHELRVQEFRFSRGSPCPAWLCRISGSPKLDSHHRDVVEEERATLPHWHLASRYWYWDHFWCSILLRFQHYTGKTFKSWRIMFLVCGVIITAGIL